MRIVHRNARALSRLLVSTSFIAILMTTTGCLIMGRQQRENPVAAENVQRITKGMPKTEVHAIMGAPNEIIFSNKALDPLREHAYIYEHVRSKYTGISFGIINFGNADEKKDRVVIFLDNDGNVESVGASLFGQDTSYGFPFGK
ncbi:MAG: outer membrane protein assembly factor BamE [Planctomycetota bacterium]